MTRDLYGESDYTAAKQAHVREIFKKHLGIVSTLAGLHPRIRGYTYIDLYAGHGGGTWSDPPCPVLHSPEPMGSPLIFLDEAIAQGLPISACFIEQNADRCMTLAQRLWDEHQDRLAVAQTYQVVSARCEDAAPRWLGAHARRASSAGEWLRGLIYADPNGELAWDLVRSLVTLCPHLDVLIYYSANQRKRQREWASKPARRENGRPYLRDPLVDLLATLGKRHWFVRELAGWKEWTFLFGTNFDGQDGIKRINFWPTDSDRGRAILRRANFTREEQATLPIDGQIPLFGAN